MTNDLKNLSEKNQAFLLTCAMRDGEKAVALLDYVVDAPVEKLRAILGELAKVPKPQLKKEHWDGLTGVRGGEGQETLLEYAEAGWILENFKDESPRVLAWLMSRIPKAKAGRVLSGLSKETRKALKGVKAGPMSPGVEAYLRNKFEARFPKVSIDKIQDEGFFEKLSGFKSDQLVKLIREIGLTEMSVAFSKVNRAATRAILHRLNVQDAKELRHRIKEGDETNLTAQREAQLNILSMELENVSPDELTLEIGFKVFSQAFNKEDASVAPLFIYKLPQRQGYILKRYIDQNTSANKTEKVEKVREVILQALENIREQLES